MNQRAKKKAEKNRRRKLTELLDLALQANGLESRTREETGNLPTVFFSFSGHVSWITVQVYPDGWECYAPHKDAMVCTGQIFSERDYQEAKELLMQALEKAGKWKPQLLAQPGNQEWTKIVYHLYFKGFERGNQEWKLRTLKGFCGAIKTERERS